MGYIFRRCFLEFPEITKDYNFDTKPDSFFIHLLAAQSPIEIATSITRDPRKVVDLCHFFFELQRQLEASDNMFREEYRVRQTINYTFCGVYEYFFPTDYSEIDITDPTSLFIRAEIGTFTNHHLLALCEGIESGFSTWTLVSPRLKESVKTIVISLRRSRVSDPKLIHRLSAISPVLYIDVTHTRVALYFESNPSRKVIVSTATELSDDCIETCNKHGHYVQR
jgi:hypothetical protein